MNTASGCQEVSHVVCSTCVFTSVGVCVCVCVFVCVCCLLSEFVFGNKGSPPLTLLMEICRMLRKSRVTEDKKANAYVQFH